MSKKYTLVLHVALYTQSNNFAKKEYGINTIAAIKNEVQDLTSLFFIKNVEAYPYFLFSYKDCGLNAKTNLTCIFDQWQWQIGNVTSKNCFVTSILLRKIFLQLFKA